MSAAVPAKGDFVSFFSGGQAGHEQKGRRPALVISNGSFNKLTGIAFVCPITNADRGYPFHIAIPPGHKVSGVVMADQLKAVDYKERKFAFLAQAPTGLLDEVLGVIGRIIN